MALTPAYTPAERGRLMNEFHSRFKRHVLFATGQSTEERAHLVAMSLETGEIHPELLLQPTDKNLRFD